MLTLEKHLKAHTLLRRASLKHTSRSSHPEVFLKRVFWKHTANLQENTHAEMWRCENVFRTTFPSEILYLDHLDYAYALIDDFLQPYLQRRKLSDDFLLPCPCLKCTRDNVCSCRKFSLPCCEFYKMSKGRYL